MSSSPESPHLDNHHRNTLRQIFEHPVSHNIEWHAVTSLFDAIGDVTVHGGKVTITVGDERQIFDHPVGKDIDAQQNDMDLDTSTPPNPAERVSELIAHAYYVGSTAASQCNGVNVPTLRRVELGASGLPVSEEIALGIEQLQVRYGVDTDDDKTVDQFLDADAVADWDNVIAARMWLLTRGECPETGFTNTNTYAMGDVVYDPDPDDGFRRQLYQSTVYLRNR